MNSQEDSNANNSVLLSIIVPFRYDPHLSYVFSRMRELVKEFPKTPDIEFIVVDSGSPEDMSEQTRALCEESDVKYLYHGSRGKRFSIGETRDFGVERALGKTIGFMDVDLRFDKDFWTRLLVLIDSYGVSQDKKSFFVVPFIYLTASETQAFIESKDENKFHKVLLNWLDAKEDTVEVLAPCSSLILVDRLHYLSVGGHSSEFRGHGYEDFELYHRLITAENKLPRSKNYFSDKKTWNTATYDGFRSQLTLLGMPALYSNLFVIHLWHPRPKVSSFYSNMATNREIWRDLFKNFDKTRDHPQALLDYSSNLEKVVFWGEPKTNISRSVRDVFPLLGPIVFMSELDFVDDAGDLNVSALEEVIKIHSIKKMFFTNPYGNEARENIYKWCNENNFPYLSFDRGCLPDSWFFDRNGFNFDSTSYKEFNWKDEISNETKLETKEYIEWVFSSDSSLEIQGDRVGADALSEKLRIGKKKVLFVPFQRPSDTVIKNFMPVFHDYEEFTKFIDLAAKLLKNKGWVVVCKKHPLEVDTPDMENVVFASETSNIFDLIDLADSVALVNSGVGVFSIMSNTPCFVFGGAFYSNEGLTAVEDGASVDGFVERVIAGYRVDEEKALRFVHFLRKSFYSFGVARYKQQKRPDGTYLRNTTEIDFYEIRLPDRKATIYKKPIDKMINTAAPRFDRFRLDLVLKKNNTNGSKPKKQKSKVMKQVVNIKYKSKLDKLLTNPHQFFADAKSRPIRVAKVAFQKKY